MAPARSWLHLNSVSQQVLGHSGHTFLRCRVSWPRCCVKSKFFLFGSMKFFKISHWVMIRCQSRSDCDSWYIFLSVATKFISSTRSLRHVMLLCCSCCAYEDIRQALLISGFAKVAKELLQQNAQVHYRHEQGMNSSALLQSSQQGHQDARCQSVNGFRSLEWL